MNKKVKVNKNIKVSGIPGVTDHSKTVADPGPDTPTTIKSTKE